MFVLYVHVYIYSSNSTVVLGKLITDNVLITDKVLIHILFIFVKRGFHKS